MHKLSTLLLVLLSLSAFSQNLVPNWSFEEYEECPEGLNVDGIFPALGWQSFRITPDYFNTCAEHPESGVPTNFFSSNRTALEGNGYGGFAHRSYPSLNSESIGIELSEPLEIGVTYYVSFYVSRGRHPNNNCWADMISGKFTVNEFEDWPEEVTMPITNSAHILHEGYITDTLNWTKIDGYFTADSVYNYLTIGNNFDSETTTVICDNEYSNYLAYYFVDCVCVSTDQNDCDELLNINEASNRNLINVFPNPISDILNIESISQTKIIQLGIYSSDGKMQIQRTYPDPQSNIQLKEVSQLATGLYTLKVILQNGQELNQKLIKI